ncbi:ATP-binding protein [Myxococcota bacterium]|jgi:energy-coupling factor transporter ATP-binding protein EcfA2|nr:ATP-binding protein [Myxococcota bacterium]
MLTAFEFENFGCFQTTARLSFLAAPRDATLPQNVVALDSDAGPLRILKQVALYGANASGKSTVIRALAAMQHLLAWSPRPGAQEFPAAEPFLFDSGAQSRPSRFRIEFVLEGETHEYEIACTAEGISHERLHLGSGRSRRLGLERTPEGMRFGVALGLRRGERDFLERRAGAQTPVLALASELEVEKAKAVRKWALDTVKPPVHCGIRWVQRLDTFTARRALENEVFRSQVVALLQDADFGIESMTIAAPERVGAAPEVRLVHRRGGVEAAIRLEAESDGTQRIFELAGPLLVTVAGDGVLFVDELDMSLHPRLTRRIVEAVAEAGTRAQLVFTTHDTSLMDVSILRRDQIWFTTRGHPGAAELVGLRQYGRRKDEAIARAYLEGRYGGVPIVSPLRLAAQ